MSVRQRSNKGEDGAAAAQEDKWAKARVAGSGSSWEKDDLLDVIYWSRQLLALALGLVWGVLGLTGFPSIVAFVAVSVVAVVFYYSRFLGVDPEDHGGAWELVKEGMMPSVGVFFVTWVCSFTIFSSDTSNLY